MIKLFETKPTKHLYQFLVLLMLTIPSPSFSQESFVYNDLTYKEDVQTVQLHPADDPLGRPIMLLGTENSLILSFDVLGDMAYTYHYTLIHCSWDWQPSDLQPTFYLEGYTEDQINDYRFSLNTLTPYIHYSLKFPTAYLKPKISGNYLLVVYESEYSPANILFSRRLYVVDPQVSIMASIPQHNRDPKYSNTHQQVDVEVAVPAYLGNIPARSFQLCIQQDGRKDNMVSGLQPSQTYTDKIVYEYFNETLFEGGNQWRDLDLKSFKYQSERIQRIIQGTDYYTVKLWEDERRHRKTYVSEKDIQGKKLIQARQDQDTDIEGDYAWVDFFLAYEAPLTHGEMHLLGAINDWNVDKNSRMKYNYQSKGYEISKFLKQGYYNYQYGIREHGTQNAETELVEGSHWETQHEYFICLYFRKPGSIHDLLIGTLLINSHE